MQLSIILVNWKSTEFTCNCIASIHTYASGIEHEIIVVDSASPDNSVDILGTIPDIQFIASPVNLGFGLANNLGARRSRGQVLLFLNPDTLLICRAIDEMLRCLLSQPAAGAVGCRLLNSDMSLQEDCVQAFPTIMNQFLDNQWIRARFPRSPLWGVTAPTGDCEATPVPVEAISGACLMVPRSVFDQAGGFSRDYFMYGEDVDLCYKIHQAGWNIYHVPHAAIVHYGGRSSGQQRENAFSDVMMRESVYRFFLRTRGIVYAQTFRAAICFASLLRLALLAAGRLSFFNQATRDRLRYTFRRWTRILRWSIGLEPWSKSLPVTGPAR